MGDGDDAPKGPARDRLGLTNGNGPPRPVGLTNGLGRGSGTGRTNGLTNGLTNGVRGRTNGLTNGLTNGVGRTNGLTNGLVSGTGRTNGTRGRTNGLANGTGRTNGTGVINGLINGSYRKGLRQNRYGVITHKDLRLGLSIIVLGLLLLGPFYLFLSTPTPRSPTQIAVDGNLGDWAGIPFINDTVASSDANIRLRAYSVLSESSGYLSFAIRVEGVILGDSTGFDGFYVYIDKDLSTSTGYRARELGADYLIAVRGGNNTVSSATLYQWTQGAESHNWTAWQWQQEVSAHASVNSIEVQLAPLDIVLSASHAFLVAATDYEGNEVFGRVHFDENLRALLIQQDVATPVVPSSGSHFASLTFTAFGGAVSVVRAPLTKDRGPGTFTQLPGFTVSVGTPLVQNVDVTFTGSDVNNYAVGHVDPAGVQVTGNVSVTVDGPNVVAYLGSAPAGHVTDGYFGDWTQFSVDTRTVSDRNVDVVNYAGNHTGTTAFVYADVVVLGRIFGGSVAPERIGRPSGGGQGAPAPPAARTGEDVFRTYIDVDIAAPAGTWVLGVRADYLVDVRGIHGRVVSASAYRWTGQWTLDASRTVTVAQDRTRMEASLDLSGVATGLMAMSMEATDWNAVSDATGVYNFFQGPGGGGTRGAPVIGPMHGTDAASVEAMPLSGDPIVDGDCSDTVYSDAGTFSDTGISGRAGTSGLYAYICIDVTGDTTSDALDQGYIYFDTDHNGGPAPDSNDRRFYVLPVGSIISDKGDGNQWVACGDPDCDTGNEAAGAFTGGHEVYEFKIAFANVWGTTTPSDGQTAGFAVRAVDITGAATYTWGSTDPPDDLVPETWGHILVPEFSDMIVPIAVVVVIYFIARRRRRDADS